MDAATLHAGGAGGLRQRLGFPRTRIRMPGAATAFFAMLALAAPVDAASDRMRIAATR